MKQLKNVKIEPLTDFEKIKLNVARSQKIDLTDLGEEQTNKALSELFKIAGKSQGVIIATAKEGKSYINTTFKGKRDKSKIFSFPEPNPICIYFNSATQHLQAAYELKNTFFSQPQTFDHTFHYANFIEYFKECSEGIIMLCSTIEGFINQLLSENLKIEINGELKNKIEIERLDIKSKIKFVIPIIADIFFDKTNTIDYSNINITIELRNDLIHLKKSYKENITNYQNLFKRLLDFDHISCSDSIFNFINTVIPDYFTETE